MNKKKVFLNIITALSLIGVGAVYGANSNNGWLYSNNVREVLQGGKTVNEKQMDMRLFWEAWGVLNRQYILEPLDGKKMVYGAVSGMTDALGDPYTVFLTPEENQQFLKDLDGVFSGIGAEIGYRDGLVVIVAPLKDSPAAKAGLLPKDKIIKIDDMEVRGVGVDAVIGMIRGEKGKAVKIQILRDEEVLDFEIIRDTIINKTVSWNMKDGQIAYISINQFNTDTALELESYADEILMKNPKGIILDLRSNPGGSLESVIEVAGKFIKKGGVVMIEKTNDKEKLHRARGGQFFEGLPMVVLVNQGSASAAEILAGALQDHKLAILVGKNTFGKGVMQEITNLYDGSALKVTVAEWLTPSGRNINKVGISPDVEVDYSLENYEKEQDPQLDMALERIKDLKG